MCKIGDIIYINKYIGDDGVEVGRHTFVVLSENEDVIEGLTFDLVTTPMSSIKNKKQRDKVKKDEKLMIIRTNDQNGMPTSKYEESFIKAHLMYYFERKNIEYQNLGSLNVETFIALQKKLYELDTKKEIENVIENLKEKQEVG